MRRLIEKLENTFAAITFAEAGEVETAREILEEEAYTHGKVAEKKEKGSEHIILIPKPKHS